MHISCFCDDDDSIKIVPLKHHLLARIYKNILLPLAFDQKQPSENYCTRNSWSTDLFIYKGCKYLICMDYFSIFSQIDLLENTKSQTVIQKLKAQFARHGIPDTCMSDYGLQYTFKEFRKFSHQWNFRHITSSPTYPQSSGKSEAAARSTKTITGKAKKAKNNPYLALLPYRNIPSEDLETSPTKQLMSR